MPDLGWYEELMRVRLIIDGMDRRRREVVMTLKGKVGRYLKLIAPAMVENMALAALKDEARPH